MIKLILAAVLAAFSVTGAAETLLRGHLACTSRETFDEATHYVQIKKQIDPAPATRHDETITNDPDAAPLGAAALADLQNKLNDSREKTEQRLKDIQQSARAKIRMAELLSKQREIAIIRGEEVQLRHDNAVMPDGCFIVRRSAPASVIEGPRPGVLKIHADAGGGNVTLWVPSEAIEQ